jgi:hypothetical protein
MNRFAEIFAVFCVLVTLTRGDTEPSPPAGSEELTGEEIYNINADMYCQTELVIKEKLLDIENPENTYTSLLGDDINDIDCEAILKQYVTRMHKRLRKDFQAKGAQFMTIHCFMDRIKELGYDKMRMRFNALYGIEVEKEKKDELRRGIDKEIGDAVETAVNECWQNQTNATVTNPAGTENDL